MRITNRFCADQKTGAFKKKNNIEFLLIMRHLDFCLYCYQFNQLAKASWPNVLNSQSVDVDHTVYFISHGDLQKKKKPKN